MFGSLQRRWNAVYADSGLDISPAATPALGWYSASSVALKFGSHGAGVSGFLGEGEFLLPPVIEDRDRNMLHLLSCFAFYSGVGQHTSWGMGMARVENGLIVVSVPRQAIAP